MARVQILAVILLLVLAGCGGNVQNTTTTMQTTTAKTATESPSTTLTTSTTTTSTTSSTTTETTTATTTGTPTPNNPWGQEVVTVAVDDDLNQSRDISPLVNETLAYWNEHASTYGDYVVEFQYTTDELRADIVVELVTEIPECGSETENTTVGCAPILETGTTARVQETVEIVAGYTDASTRRILKHEFGHVLGIEHGEEPMPAMRSWTETTYFEKSDAGDRALPWQNETLSVYIDMENQTYHQTAREQVRHALSYYEDGAEGTVPDNVSFVVIENRSAADIVVSAPLSVTCGSDHSDPEGTCGRQWGYDTDTDEALEYYSRAEIKVAHQVEVDLVGWYVGYWLADAFGLSESELPPPFVDADYETASGEWWET